jgi:hypothetical protein
MLTPPDASKAAGGWGFPAVGAAENGADWGGNAAGGFKEPVAGDSIASGGDVSTERVLSAIGATALPAERPASLAADRGAGACMGGCASVTTGGGAIPIGADGRGPPNRDMPPGSPPVSASGSATAAVSAESSAAKLLAAGGGAARKKLPGSLAAGLARSACGWLDCKDSEAGGGSAGSAAAGSSAAFTATGLPASCP